MYFTMVFWPCEAKTPMLWGSDKARSMYLTRFRGLCETQSHVIGNTLCALDAQNRVFFNLFVL